MKLVLILLIIYCFQFSFFPQDGNLDRSFGIGGIVHTSIGEGDAVAHSVAIQSDEKIILCGESIINSQLVFTLVRYNTNGTLDTTFGQGGIVTTFIAEGSGGRSVLVQPDNKIVVGGGSALARYNENGSLDETFGTGGIVHFLSIAVDGIGIQPDNKILVAGGNTDGNLALIRCNTNGSFDETFGAGGIVLTEITAHVPVWSFGKSVAIQADGKIVLDGYYTHELISDEDITGTVLARYNIDGTLDESFGVDGIVKIHVGYDFTCAYSIVLQSDNKIILGGWKEAGQYWNAFTVLRCNTNGLLDGSFGNGGVVITEVGNNTSKGYSVILQSDGKIILVGEAADSNWNDDIALVRYNTNGAIDETFGEDGIVVTIGSLGDDGAYAIALQSDGKIIAAGYSENRNTLVKEFVVARYYVNVVSVQPDTFIPYQFQLFDNYPNPFNPSTTIKYLIPELSFITLKVYDVLGNEIATLVYEEKPIGSYEAEFDATQLPSGIYFYRLQVYSANGGAGSFVETKKMVLLR